MKRGEGRGRAAAAAAACLCAKLLCLYCVAHEAVCFGCCTCLPPRCPESNPNKLMCCATPATEQYVYYASYPVAQTTKLKPLRAWPPAACRVSWLHASSPSSDSERRWQTQPNLHKSKSVAESSTMPRARWLKATRYGLLGVLLRLPAAARLSSALTLRLGRAARASPGAVVQACCCWLAYSKGMRLPSICLIGCINKCGWQRAAEMKHDFTLFAARQRRCCHTLPARCH